MTAGQVVERYLRDLERAARPLPAEHARELVDDVAEHLAAARAADDSEAAVRTAIGRLGSPESIVAAAFAEAGIVPVPARIGWGEALALVGISIGFLLFVVGWILGLAFLWSSQAWTTRQKLVGTLVPPGGLGGFALILVRPTLYSLPPAAGTPLAIGWLVAAVASPIWLATRVARNGPAMRPRATAPAER
ncbi:MAG: hypothetical protein DLM56_05015 [Pseudonocardiales bacterium]|nr:MAG: hypothetical protein DLM56_05015 [Pseudonocardiales bacterium]